jgi:hypothetical protein
VERQVPKVHHVRSWQALSEDPFAKLQSETLQTITNNILVDETRQGDPRYCDEVSRAFLESIEFA